MTGATRVITMTEEELLAYTENVVKMAIEKKTPVRIAQRQALTEQLNDLDAHMKSQTLYGNEHMHSYTKTEDRVIEQARTQRPSESIAELRKQIRTTQRALRCLEAAHTRHIRKWESQKAASAARLDRRMAMHEGHKCSQTCQKDKDDIAISRVVNTAPPLTRSQLIKLGQLLAS